MTTPTPPLKLAYTPKDAAKVISVGQKRMYEMCRTNEIACFRNGNSFIIPHSSLEAWLEIKTKQHKAALDAVIERALQSK